jgi:hypothetical protein
MLTQNTCKVYISLGFCLVAIITVISIVSHSSTTEVEIEAINSIKNKPGPKRVNIESSNIHNTNALVEGDVSLDLHGSTIAALVFGAIILVATISFASVKITAWKRKYASSLRHQPPPEAPHPPGIPLTPMAPHPALHHVHPGPSAPGQDPHTYMQRPSAPYPDAKVPSPEDPALSPLEIAVAKMITRDKENVYHSPPHPGTPL